MKCFLRFTFHFILQHTLILLNSQNMATTANTSCCFTDCITIPSVTCLGCPNVVYCYKHHKEHRHYLNIELEKLIDKCNQCHQEMDIQMKNPQSHALMKAIDEWEKRSITKIRQVAQKNREKLLPLVKDFIPEVNAQLEALRNELPKDPDKCEFVDTHITNWTEKLNMLKLLLSNAPYFSIQEKPTEFISIIHLKPVGKSEFREKLSYLKLLFV